MTIEQPCPFCGSYFIEIEGDLEWEDGAPYADKPVSCVVCQRCRARGPTIEDDNYDYDDDDGKAESALKSWNERVIVKQNEQGWHPAPKDCPPPGYYFYRRQGYIPCLVVIQIEDEHNITRLGYTLTRTWYELAQPCVGAEIFPIPPLPDKKKPTVRESVGALGIEIDEQAGQERLDLETGKRISDE